MYAKFRSRAATRWPSREEKRKATAEGNEAGELTGFHPYDDPYAGRERCRDNQNIASAVAMLAQISANRKRQSTYRRKEWYVVRFTRDLLEKYFGPAAPAPTQAGQQQQQTLVVEERHAYVDQKDTSKVFKELQGPAENGTDHPSRVHRHSGRDTEALNIRQKKAMRVCTLVLEYLRRGFEQSREKAQVLLLVHGGPGTGKTFFARRLNKAARQRGLRVLGAAFAGGAAGNMIKGSTIHTLFALPVKKRPAPDQRHVPQDRRLPPLTGPQLKEARDKFKNVAILLLDELSMVNPVMLGHIHQRLGEILEKPGLPFGGMSIVAFCDFFQLPPTSGKSLSLQLLTDLLPPTRQWMLACPANKGRDCSQSSSFSSLL